VRGWQAALLNCVAFTAWYSLDALQRATAAHTALRYVLAFTAV
jgi:hypothetical protein